MNAVTKTSVAHDDGSVRIDTAAGAGLEAESTRARALLLVTPESLQTMDAEALASVQAVLAHGPEFGRWVTPQRWFPSGRPAKMDVNLEARIRAQMVKIVPRELVEPAIDTAVGQRLLRQAAVTLTRYLIIMRMGPAGMGRKGSGTSLDPSMIADRAYSIATSLFAVALAKWLQAGHDIATAGHGFLHVVKIEDLYSLTVSQRELVLSEVSRMHVLHERGWWTDLPAIGGETIGITPVAGAAAPSEPQRKREPHLPLPDEYVSEMGIKSVWLIESLGPGLLELAARLRDLWIATDDGGKPRVVERRRRREVALLLASWEWKDAKGVPIVRPPFDLRLCRAGHKPSKNENTSESTDLLVWPPRNLARVFGLLGNVQLAHLFVVSLSTGGRKSETLDLRRNCVEYARNGRPYAHGRTYKLVQKHDGELRDWALPDLAVQAIEQQSRLVALVEAIGLQKPNRGELVLESADPQDHLWVQVSAGAHSDRSQRLINLDKAIQAYARTLCMEEKPSGQWIRPHRFRKTVARLVALALTQAPKILMDVFGHKSIEMTLYYILSDKDLQSDIERVSRELRVMRAADSVSAMVEVEEGGSQASNLGGYGGPAALMIQRAVEIQKTRVHQRGEQWGANSVLELAEILTLQGKAWEVVRPGVMCTKMPGTESGPCNKSKGHPEPARCQTGCNHRLEEAFLREDVNGAIADCVAEFTASRESGDELMQALWAGQICAHLPRFEDLRVKWNMNFDVQQALALNDEANEKVMA